MDEFIEWYCSEPRLSFNRIVVTRYRIQLRIRILHREQSMEGLRPYIVWPTRPRMQVSQPGAGGGNSASKGCEAVGREVWELAQRR